MESDWSAKRGWTPARTLTAFGTDVLGPLSLAADARGDAVIAWAAANRVRVSYRPAGRGWQPPRTLSLSGDSVGAPPGPLVALDDRGRALVAWSAERGAPSLATTPDGRLALTVWLTRIGDNGQCGAVRGATFKR